MTTGEREQLGWEVAEDVFASFKRHVRIRWGAEKPFLNRELEDAIRAFLAEEGNDPPSGKADSGTTGLDATRTKQDLLTKLPENSQSRTTVWTSVHTKLKQDLAAVADATECPKWVVLTIAVQDYLATSEDTLYATTVSDESGKNTVTSPESEHHRAGSSEVSQQAVIAESLQEDCERPAASIVSGANLARCDGGSGVGGVYPSTSEPTVGSQVVDETPVSPVGLTAECINLVPDVLTRLPGPDDGLPQPFSEPELYRSAAAVGVPVWVENAREVLKEEVQERLNYEWDAELTQFAPVLDEELVETIITAAESIAPAIDTELTESTWEKLSAWYELHGLDPGAEARTIVARQAVLNVLLKMVQYEWHYQQGDLPALGDDPQEALQLAGERLDTAGFESSVLDEIVWTGDGALLEAVIEERYRVLQSPTPSADIGNLYESLLSNESRQRLRQFMTPPDMGQVMRARAASSDETVLDLGMGASELSTPRYSKWLDDTIPEQFEGVERSPLAAVMGATVQLLSRQSAEIHVTDFFKLSPGDLDQEVSAVVSNPPYTSHEELPEAERDAMKSEMQQETGLEITGKPPLYAYFYYHARSFLLPGNRACFLSPHNFLAANHGETLKQHLLDEYDIRALVLVNPENGSVFDDAMTTSLVAFLEARDDESTPGCTRFIRVDGDPSTGALLDAVRNADEGSTEWGFVNCVQQQELQPAQNWQPLFNPVDIDTSQLTSLSTIADVSRGILTGENDFFCLSQEDVDETGTEDRYLSQFDLKPRHVDGYDFREGDWERLKQEGVDVWLLYHLEGLAATPKSVQDARKVADE